MPRSTNSTPSAPSNPSAQSTKKCCSAPPAEAKGASGGERKTVHVDVEARQRNLLRLRRIEGQVRGVMKMVEDDRYCADALGQITAVQAALKAVGVELLRHHLKHCVADAMRRGDVDAVSSELCDLFEKGVR